MVLLKHCKGNIIYIETGSVYDKFHLKASNIFMEKSQVYFSSYFQNYLNQIFRFSYTINKRIGHHFITGEIYTKLSTSYKTKHAINKQLVLIPLWLLCYNKIHRAKQYTKVWEKKNLIFGNYNSINIGQSCNNCWTQKNWQLNFVYM